jgi:hypothetical protein
MIIRVDLPGDDKTTIYAAARRLLAAGAGPDDTVETWRDGMRCMSGRIGECAKWTVRETDIGLYLVKWRPFPAYPFDPVA